MQQYSIAIGIDPKLADAHNNLGLALLDAGKPDQTEEAEQEFRTAISLRQNFADAENNLGTLVGQEGRMPKRNSSSAMPSGTTGFSHGPW